MAALDPTKSRVMEFVAAFVIFGFTGMMAFITVAPYFGLVPISGSDAAIVAQHQTTIQNVTLAIISFLFGASVGNQKKDDAINTLANTAQATQAATTPAATVVTPEVKVPLKAGETASVTAGPVPQTTPK